MIEDGELDLTGQAAGAPAPIYRAFISYSHLDTRLTQRLHRKLESYSVPKSVRSAGLSSKPIPAHLRPVFRDRDELASATRLSDTIQEALDQSQALVVVCSPAAVASAWVNAEIDYFRRRHPDRPVLAFVVAGDPGLDPRKDPAKAALPLALALEDPDAPEGKLGEPMAADARDVGDGFTAACLKLVAGLLGVRYDQLRQREQKRSQLRWAVLGTASLALTAVFAFMAWQATAARDLAKAAQANAELELESEQQTRAFLLSVFELADANESRGNQATVRQVLDRAVEKINRTEFKKPVTRARFLATMGQAYSSLGLNRKSVELLQSSILALENSLNAPPDRSQRIDSRIELAEIFFDMGEYDKSMLQLDLAAKPGDPFSIEQEIRIANSKGNIALYRENDSEAGKHYGIALSLIKKSKLTGEKLALLMAKTEFGLAQLDYFAGKFLQADQGITRALDQLVPAVGETHPDVINLRVTKGSIAYAAGARKTARADWTASLSSASKIYDASNPVMGTIKNNLGLLLLEDGDLKAAEPMLREALASDRQHRSENFDDLAYPLANLAYTRFFLGDTNEARKLLEEALPIAEASDHAMKGPILNGLADILCSDGNAAKGLAFAEASAQENSKRHPPDHWRIAQSKLTLAYCGQAAGVTVDRSEMSRLSALLRKKFGPRSPFTRRGEAQAKASGPIER